MGDVGLIELTWDEMWETRWIMMHVGPCEQGTLGNVVLD